MKLNSRGNLALYLAMISLVIATIFLIAIAPLPANAACSQDDWIKAKHTDFVDKKLESLHDELNLSEAQQTEWITFIVKSKLTQQQPHIINWKYQN